MVADLEAMIDPTKIPEAQQVRATSDAYFAEINKPKIFTNGPDGYIIQQENAFEELCAILEENGTANPKELTVYVFMARAAHCERKFKAKTNS